MILFGKKLSKNYGLEIALFHHLRQFSDGLTLFNFNVNWDRYFSDHTPRFVCHVIALNFTLIEINIYYLHHNNDRHAKRNRT
jgi:hypothetical protein